MPVGERATAQGLVWTFSRVGGAAVPFLFALMLGLFGTWTTPFWVMGGLGVLWCAAFWPWFRDRPEQARGVNRAERAYIAANRPDTGTAEGPIPLRQVLGSPNVWGLCAMYVFNGFAGNFFTSLLPAIL